MMPSKIKTRRHLAPPEPLRPTNFFSLQQLPVLKKLFPYSPVYARPAVLVDYHSWDSKITRQSSKTPCPGLFTEVPSPSLRCETPIVTSKTLIEPDHAPPSC